VRRRVDVDESLPSAPVPGRILNEIRNHALESRPEECCGLIVGDEHERFKRVERCRNDMTQLHSKDPVEYPRDGTSAFFLSPADFVRVEKELAETKERVTAVYHSHVGAGPYLSEMDLEYAEHVGFPFPDAGQIVIEVYDGEGGVGRIGLFQREGMNRPFEGRLVVPDEG
jgi:proteasome lid subunit RPN8/RPN11